MRFVSLRMSQDEYDRLKVLGKKCGSPSLSSFIRSSVNWILSNGHKTFLEFMIAPEPARGWNARTDESEIAALLERIGEFDRELEQLKSIRDRLSGQPPRADEGSPAQEIEHDSPSSPGDALDGSRDKGSIPVRKPQTGQLREPS
jgi:hypothetical protein